MQTRYASGPACGFTIIELLIAVAIVGILAAIAYPSYQEYVLRGKFTEATARLAGDRVRLEQYYQDNRTYAGFAGLCAAGAVKAKYPPAAEHFDYSCSVAADGQTYTLFATGRGPTAGFEFTIDQSNNRRTTLVPGGWAASASCWIQRKNGTC